MVSGRHKSGTLRKVFRRATSGAVRVHRRKRKPAKAKCANCGTQLSGVPRERQKKMQKMPKTSKRPQRPFGGVLCPSCMRKEIIKRARK